MTCKTVVVDTGAGTSFIRKAILPRSILDKVQPLAIRTDIRDANNRRVQILGTVNLVLRIGNRSETVRFNVCERLGTDVIVGYDYLDKHVEAIRPRKRLIELDDGTSVPILGRGTRSKKLQGTIPEEEQLPTKMPRVSRRISVHKPAILKPGSQTWIEAITQSSGLVLVEPNKKLYESHMCLAGNGIAQVERDKPFRILVANFGRTERKLLTCLLYTSPSPRDKRQSRMPSSA